MNAIIFLNLLEAKEFEASMDAALEYPKGGIDMGSGIFAPETQTLHASYIQPHPTQSKWAYMVFDDIVQILPHGKTVVELTNDWFPSAP